MFGKVWYHQLVRKYVICVGTLFNDISIIRTETYDPSTPTTQLLKVPITYAPKEKMMVRIIQDPNIDRPSATTTLPTISFEMGKISYDPSRKLNSMNKIQLPASGATSGTLGAPVPYNIDFKVYIYVKNTEDGTKILEQILPYFTPAFTVTATLIPEFNVTMDIPITLDSVDYEDTYTGDFQNRRAIIWTLSLTLKGYFFGPTKTQSVIKFAQTNMYTSQGFDGDSLCASVGLVKADEVYTIQPGQMANGYPTSNIALTIPYQQINANSDFGYIENTYNPPIT
jgi:hypothetical protein